MADKKLFYGTMNASKSAQLLMQAYNFERQGKSFLIFKPCTDTRDKGVVRSRALDEERPATLIFKDDINAMRTEVSLLSPDFVFVDELQFMPPTQVEELSLIAIELNIPVFAYGLVNSYTGEMFNGTKKAIECGFTLHELKMQCDFCKNKATNHLLYINDELVKDGEPIHVGDQEYKSVCYKCFRDKRKK